MKMTRSPLWNFLLLALAAAAIGVVWNFHLRRQDTAVQTRRDTRKPSISPFYIKGFSTSVYEHGRPLSMVKADEFLIRPRRFLFFNIRPFNEAIMTHALFKIYRYDDMPEKGEGLFSFGKDVLPLNTKGRKATVSAIGLVTRCRIKGFKLEVYHGKNMSLFANADRVEFDLKRKKARMIHVVMNNVRESKSIECDSAVWYESKEVFKIPGTYRMLNHAKMSTGKGISVDLKFATRPL